MARANGEANWVNIDIAALPTEVRESYDTMKAIYRQYKLARDAFEARMAAAAGVPEGKRCVFGYNFGKLSVAIVDDERKPVKAKQASMTLADFIATQGAQGRAV